MGKEIFFYIDVIFLIYKVGNIRLFIGDSLVGSIVLMIVMIYLIIFSWVVLLSLMYNENIKKKIDICMNKG